MPQAAYLEERADAVAEVEKHIGELGQIFHKLAHMVQEQGHMLERVDDDVSTALVNMEAAEDQLWIKHKSVSSNKMLILKIFGILFLFMVFFMLFIA